MRNTIIQIIALASSWMVGQVKGYNVLAHWSLNGSEPGLILEGGPTFVEGRYPGSKAINFNQTSNCYAKIPKVELRGKNFTIALWIKVSDRTRHQYFFSDWYDPWQFYLSIYDTKQFVFERHSGAQPWFKLWTTNPIATGKWTHVAVIWNQDAGNVTLVIDGKEDAFKKFSTDTVWQPPVKDTYQIGDDGHWDNHQFQGSIMDLYIIEAALSSEELISLKGYFKISSLTSYINNTVAYTNETVRCEAQGSPTPYLAWVRRGIVLVNKTFAAEVNVTDNDGEYVCLASNREGTAKIIIKVKGSLHYTASSINQTSVYINETVKCQSDGSPTSYVVWKRSGVVLVNKTPSAEITINENNGEYQCIAFNQKGIDKLIVKAQAPLRLCHDHLLMTDISRAVNRIFKPSQSRNDSTDIDLSKWYRIQNPVGNELATTCVPQNRCGTQAPGWLNGSYPSVQDGIVKRTVCFHFNGDCCYQNTTVYIRKCFGFYVFKFSRVPKQLPAPRYCIEHRHIDTPEIKYFTFATSANTRQALVGHVMYSETDVSKDLICLNYCIIIVKCKSFNYSKEKKVCELNNSTRQEYPESIIKSNTFVYYEKFLHDLYTPT